MVSVEALRDALEVSLATIRRDLQELEHRGLLSRTHGGAIPIESLFCEAFRHFSAPAGNQEPHPRRDRDFLGEGEPMMKSMTQLAAGLTVKTRQ